MAKNNKLISDKYVDVNIPADVDTFLHETENIPQGDIVRGTPRTEEQIANQADRVLGKILELDANGKPTGAVTELGEHLTNSIADMLGRDRDEVYIDFDQERYDEGHFISIVDEHFMENGIVPEEDILDISLTGYDVGKLLRDTVLEMGMIHQEMEQVNGTLGVSVDYVRKVSDNDLITTDTHLLDYKQGRFWNVEQKPQSLYNRVDKTWKSYKNSYEWLINGSKLKDTIADYYKSINEELLPYNTPGYWMQVADYMNNNEDEETGFNSTDYDLGDFFAYLRKHHIHTKDLGDELVTELYQYWEAGNDEGFLERLRAEHPEAVKVEMVDKGSAKMAQNAIMGRATIRLRTGKTQSMIPNKYKKDKKPK